MKKSDLRVLSKIFNQASDAYLILGRKKDKKANKSYVLGWKPRHLDKMVNCRTYKKLDSAREAFEAEAFAGGPEYHEHFFEDPFQHTLYGWEETFLQDDKKISQKDAAKLIKRVAKDYGIKPPSLKWKKKEDGSSHYNSDKHKIVIGGRDKITVLHEMAHAIEEAHYGDDSYSHHSPAFAWLTIELYNRYAGFNMSYLVTTAHQAGIIGDINAPQILPEHSMRVMKPQKEFRA